MYGLLGNTISHSRGKDGNMDLETLFYPQTVYPQKMMCTEIYLQDVVHNMENQSKKMSTENWLMQ